MGPLWNILLFLAISILLSRLSTHLKYKNELLVGKELQKVDMKGVLKRALKILNDPEAPHSSHLYALEMLKETGSSEGRRLLADFLFAGTWKLDADYAGALKMYEQLANDGDAHGLYMLGIYYAEGIIYERSFPKSLVYFTYAAKENSRHAQLACAYLYANGIGVKPDAYMAKRYLLKAAEMVVQEIKNRNIRPLKPNLIFSLDGIKQPSRGKLSQASLVEFYKFSSGDSSPDVLLTLGQIYYYGGSDIEPDFENARSYFELALKKGSLGAYGFLGQMYYRGEGVEPDLPKAFHYFREGIRASGSSAGAGAAYNGMGLCYMNGIEVTEDHTEALEYFLKGIQNGSIEAMYNAAILMLKDDSPAYQDIAIDLLMNASKQGFLLANVELAKLHSKNDRLHNLCLYLLRTFFERYEVNDMLENGVVYYRQGKLNQALSRFLLLAYEGFETAQYNVAFIYNKQIKTNPKYAQRAAVWFYRAAQGGDKVARVRLGDVFFYGTGLDKSYPAAAVANYLISMNEKNAEGAYSVGYLYEKGIGVPKDFYMARLYYETAIELKPEAYWPIQLVLFKLSLIEAFGINHVEGKRFIVILAVLSVIISIIWVVFVFNLSGRDFFMNEIVNVQERRDAPQALHPVPLPVTPEPNEDDFVLPEEIPLLEDIDH